MPRVRLLILLLFASAATAWAQHYPILPVTGSPHGVSTLMRDSRSALWLGSTDNVYCFDGLHFYSLRQYGFPAEEPIAFSEDSEHGIWIATRSSTVAPSGPAGGNLYRYADKRVEKIYSGKVQGMVGSAPGTMLVSAFDAARTITSGRDDFAFADLYVFRKTDRGWRGTKVLSDGSKQLTRDHNGWVLFPCPGGWCELSQAQISAWPRSELRPKFNKFDQYDLGRVLRDRFGCTWFRNPVATDYQCPGHPLTAISDVASSPDTLMRIEETEDGSVMLFGASGLAVGRPEKMQLLPTRGLHGVNAMAATPDGTILLANDDGLFRYMYPFRLEYWGEDDGMPAAWFVSRIGGEIFASNVGIQVLDSNRLHWRDWATKDAVGTAVHLLAGQEDTIYAASYTRGVVQLDRKGRVLARSKLQPGSARLARDSQGNIWLAANGVKMVKRHNNQLILLSEGLDGGVSPDITYDAKNHALWACHDSSVAVLKEGRWTQLYPKDGIVDDRCRSITVLASGDAWVGYAVSSAVSRIRQSPTGSFSIDTFPTNTPEASGTYFLDTDRRNWLWRASDSADYLATPDAVAHGEWIALGSEDGIPAPGGNQNSFSSDSDGSIWFANGKYVMHFNPPAGFATDFPSPQVFISGFTLGSGAPSLFGSVSSMAYGKPMVVHVGALQFNRRNALRVRYRLLPDKPAWRTGHDFDLILGKLPWGKHTLQVQAQLATGPWSPVTEQSFAVLKPFWLTWPALAIFALSGGGAFAGSRWWIRVRKQGTRDFLPDLAEWRMIALSPELQQLDGTMLDGRFEVGRVLARGGFATVIEGRDLEQNGIACAIKVFRRELMDKEWMAKRFQHEIRALAKIHHPNVVRIYGHGATPEGIPYLVMEFIKGRTLRAGLEHGALPRTKVAEFLLQTGSALAEIHRHGICHRDLKPENLMLREASDPGEEIVLIDFSIAIVQDPDETLHGLSRAAGTLHYMAPEQAIGYADASTDIYSFAKLAIEMLTGQRLSILLPDASMDLPQRVRELLTGLSLSLSPGSIDSLSAALEFDPSRRPRNALDFATGIAHDLRSFPEGT